jgi:hypothetical protein
MSSTLLSAATARNSARTSSRKNSRSFSRNPSTVKLLRYQALMSEQHLHVAQICATLIEQERPGRMPQGMCRNDRHPSSLAGQFDPGIECLVAKGSAVAAGKD